MYCKHCEDQDWVYLDHIYNSGPAGTQFMFQRKEVIECKGWFETANVKILNTDYSLEIFIVFLELKHFAAHCNNNNQIIWLLQPRF